MAHRLVAAKNAETKPSSYRLQARFGHIQSQKERHCKVQRSAKAVELWRVGSLRQRMRELRLMFIDYVKIKRASAVLKNFTKKLDFLQKYYNQGFLYKNSDKPISISCFFAAQAALECRRSAPQTATETRRAL
ncbi:MAG: hypothetical protein A2Y14_04570 [Verrucomicrobia bacterium GWF2_51_19]|nr:MAG: hypothetical protein A2Y14_04570 [Verrucomicrobia bacterium GWF2_51_19]HCJ12522.1 hypothetical protein [Opitutae bacterium]